VVAETTAGGVLAVRSSGGQGSHQLGAMARADALAVLPDGDGVAAGDAVEVILVGEPRSGALTRASAI
jgi:molybdopterin biosynthesis enzyme